MHSVETIASEDWQRGKTENVVCLMRWYDGEL